MRKGHDGIPGKLQLFAQSGVAACLTRLVVVGPVDEDQGRLLGVREVRAGVVVRHEQLRV